MNSGIYCIKNIINNKCYIGRASDLKNRKSKHFGRLRNNSHPNKYLQNSYNKYNEENFQWIVLEIVNSKITLPSREKYWEQQYRQRGIELYNIMEVDNSQEVFVHSTESKKKMKEAAIGRKRSIESINKTKNAHKITILQIDKDNGMIIKVWNSMVDAAQYFNVSKTAIYNACRGKCKTICGFKWQYA